jgi:hypothetical protein|tara:strand:- start:4924 stop:5115 length:192 start_codon:yes stop_codon:yes gene_type:complete
MPTDNKTPKNIIKLPKFEGGDDSITTIYRNHTSIPEIAMYMLKKYSPRNKAVKNPIIAPNGII